jgi:long-chain acyl-CoA synthetase
MTAAARGHTVRRVNVAASVPAAAAHVGTKIAGRLGVSYRALDTSSARVAGLLSTRGIEPGDRVAVMVPNVPELAIVCYGVLRAGAVVVVLDSSLAEREVALRLGDVGLLFAWHAVAEAAEAAARRAATPCLFVTPGQLGRLLRGIPAMREVRERDDADPAIILDGAGGRRLTHGELSAAVREQGVTALLCARGLSLEGSPTARA